MWHSYVFVFRAIKGIADDIGKDISSWAKEKKRLSNLPEKERLEELRKKEIIKKQEEAWGCGCLILAGLVIFGIWYCKQLFGL